MTDTAHNHHSSSLLLDKSVSLLMTKEEPWGLGRVLCQEQIPKPTCLTLCSAFMCHRVTEAPGGKSLSHKTGNGMGVRRVCREKRIRRAPEQHPTPTPLSFTLHLCCLPPQTIQTRLKTGWGLGSRAGSPGEGAAECPGIPFGLSPDFSEMHHVNEIHMIKNVHGSDRPEV